MLNAVIQSILLIPKAHGWIGLVPLYEEQVSDSTHLTLH